jgi:hypothetical protein
MFVVKRKLPRKDRWCVLLCRSERQGKKIHQRTVKYFGVAHGEEELRVLMGKARLELRKQCNTHPALTRKTSSDPDLCHGTLLSDVVEVARTTEGFHDIMGPCFDKLGLSSLLTPTRYQQLKDLFDLQSGRVNSVCHHTSAVFCVRRVV